MVPKPTWLGRYRGDMGEIWGRSGGDAGEMQGRCRGGGADAHRRAGEGADERGCELGHAAAGGHEGGAWLGLGLGLGVRG